MKKRKTKVQKPIKVMVAIPNQGSIRRELAVLLIDMVTQSVINKKYEIDLRFSTVTNIDFNRNKIVGMFLKTDCKYLLMIDDDNPCLKNPLDLIELKKDIIIYPTFMAKTMDGKPIINYNVFNKQGKKWKSQVMTPGKPLMEYDAGGTGCILIKRKVLESLEAPFKSKMNKDGTRDVGSDLWFCERARRKGFKIWAHWDYSCMHFKDYDLLNIGRMLIETANRINKNNK